MSEFTCSVVRCEIIPHPSADLIEICKVGDYQSIVKKGQFQTGELAVYIPEAAVVPEWMLREMGMWDDVRNKGGLHGAAGTRVKAIKLRGILSQGLMWQGVNEKGYLVIDKPAGEIEVAGVMTPLMQSCLFEEEGDAAEFLGIIKYEPALPMHMRAKVIGVDWSNTHGYDFDNLKKTPTMFEDGEGVVVTEKIHGTLMCVGVVPTLSANDKYYKSRVIVTSKGMGRQGYVLDHNDDSNVYAAAAKRWGLLETALHYLGLMADMEKKPVFIFGEVFGLKPGGGAVQEAGMTYGDEELDYRAFDICVGNRGQEIYAQWDQFAVICDSMDVKTVPLLYQGPYSKETVLSLTDGKTTLGGGHIREGVVVKSAYETRNAHHGRKCAKSVSESYLLRKGETSELQ